MHRFRLRRIFFFSLSLALIVSSNSLLGCSKNSNLLKIFVNKNSNETIFSDAKIHLNHSECDKALELLETLPISFLERRDVNFTHSTAYACRFGMNTLSLITSIEAPLFNSLATFYQSASASQIEDARKAVDLIVHSYSEPQNRNINENIYLSFLSLSQIGVILSVSSDKNNDSKRDETFNPCEEESLSNEMVIEIGIAISHAFLSFSAIGNTLTSKSKENIDEEIDLVQDFCHQLQSLISILPGQTPEESDSCVPQRSEDYTPLHLQAIRSLINEKETLGMGSCESDTIEECVCL